MAYNLHAVAIHRSGAPAQWDDGQDEVTAINGSRASQTVVSRAGNPWALTSRPSMSSACPSRRRSALTEPRLVVPNTVYVTVSLIDPRPTRFITTIPSAPLLPAVSFDPLRFGALTCSKPGLCAVVSCPCQHRGAHRCAFGNPRGFLLQRAVRLAVGRHST